MTVNPEVLRQIKAREFLMDPVQDEANAFAMELLMPADWVIDDLKRLGGIDIEDEGKIEKLARRYKVSTAVMILRVGQLIGLYGP